MKEISGRFEALSAEQRALLEARLKRRGLAPATPTGPDVSQQQSNSYAHPRTAPSQKESRTGPSQMKFGIYFFSDDGSSCESDKYSLLLECAKFADRNEFCAVWTPERHFQKFGGLYPNPSVLGAALAVITERIAIRAGSVALPLHHPVRVAEEWSIVDNLSRGRVAISFASGWHPDDFIFAPSSYETRKEVMYEGIEKIQRLWAGEAVAFDGIAGQTNTVHIFPKPIQTSLPVWITTAGTPATWIKAGEIGANVLCALVGYALDELGDNIRAYRKARREHGHDPVQGKVAVMVHTYIAEDDNAAKALVRAPMCHYLRNYFQQFQYVVQSAERITEEDKMAIVSRAFDAYYDDSLLIGSPGKCGALVDRLIEAGADELACLVDFGLEFNSVMQGLERLVAFKQSYAQRDRPAAIPVRNES
ncbi:MAG TPA: MupA/Atu3671 family FMN-dependent luciferase-like monooxygenase [Blastocatellia bacterium]|nr:MupA/Atu3671 family FMN-dependent luciferase-like monooxygenase [Blastocatellia bacterium]